MKCYIYFKKTFQSKRRFGVWGWFFLSDQSEIFWKALKAFFSPSLSDAKMLCTVRNLIYRQSGGSSFVQMCASLNACPQKDKNHWTVLHGANRHWHALHQAKESLFSTAFSCLPQNIPSSSSIFSHLICQRLKKQRERSRGERLPLCCTATRTQLKSEPPLENVWNSCGRRFLSQTGCGFIQWFT